jgi:rhomboid-like protein
VPEGYRDEDGLAFRATPLSKSEASKIFGAGIDVGMANRVLRILHGRRVAGTLEDPSLRLPSSGFEDRIKSLGLGWLRKHVPVDEDDSAAQRALIELEEMKADILADSERIGLYRPNAGETVKDKSGNASIYGESALDRVRAANKARWEEEEKQREIARKKQEEEIRQNTGTLTTTDTAKGTVVLRRKGENPWLKYYLERAKVLPDVPPEMSPFQRLWPSGLVALAVILGSILFAQTYKPPQTRLWPDMPPAAATVTAIIALNTVVFCAWRFPPAFRLLNKYFISVPGYPRALAVLGNTFSHQTLSHLLLNMVAIWFIGTRLHDDVGRANFLAIYLSSGVFASFASLAVFSFKRHFVTSSLGASGSIAGIMAAYLYLHANDYFKFFGLPPEPYQGVPGWLLLSCIVIPDLYGLRRVGKAAGQFDHYAHLGGFFAGVVGAELVKESVRKRREALARRRRERFLSPRDRSS